MASSKEIQISTRPLSQHRQSISSGSPASSSLGAIRPSTHSRNSSHSHSTLSGALNAHRVTRRKSMNNTLANAANVAAVAAALEEAGDKVTSLPIAVAGSRRSTISKSSTPRAPAVGSLPSPPASLPSHKFMMNAKMEGLDSAIDDELNDMSADEGEDGSDQARVRRASDGQPLTKDGKKSSRIELKCEKCGKGYKHSSCLTKHLWEHTPEWSYTSKLLISKHQQVQLLEAASVLVAMNVKEDGDTPPESTKDIASDPESASPDASAYSDIHDDRSSADTTPPPQTEGIPMTHRDNSKRYSNGSGYARSYQSGVSSSFMPGSIPNGSSFGHTRLNSADFRRPPSSGRNRTSQDDHELAAGLEMLSCSYNSNGGPRDARLPADAPPVPPLPREYMDQAALSSTPFFNSFSSRQMPESFTRGEFRRGEDVKMEESEESVADDDEIERRSRARGSEDDEMMFGHMEE